jgi:hypothetical protein
MRRLHDEILLERDPADSVPGRNIKAAITVAQQQAARTPLCKHRLRSSSSIDRPPRRRCPVLAPALDGFEPTPGMPEIAEAQALLSRLR